MSVVFREAERGDLRAIVAMLTDDILGADRESDDTALYEAAFDAIAGRPGDVVIVGEDAGQVIATYQLTLIPTMSHGAALRAQVESVRVASERRGQGIGAALLADAEERARAGGARLVQFTSNKVRDRAHAFYLRSGYEASHVGFKKMLV